MRINRYHITHAPNTCGNCRLFVRDKQDGKLTCVGHCAIRDRHSGTCSYAPSRRQSMPACRRMYSPLGESLRHAGYQISVAEDGKSYTAEAEFDSCALEAPTLTALYQLINARFTGEV